MGVEAAEQGSYYLAAVVAFTVAEWVGVVEGMCKVLQLHVALIVRGICKPILHQHQVGCWWQIGVLLRLGDRQGASFSSR